MMRPEVARGGVHPVMRDLFAPDPAAELAEPMRLPLAPGAMLIRGSAALHADQLWADLQRLLGAAPPRHMVTPGGFRMSVAMSNCGAMGWVSDARGYRYDTIDPDSGSRWPPLPASFVQSARRAAIEAGYRDFTPDACLISRYAPGARLTLHQDRDEEDFDQPIVSISLGLPAVFLFGGLTRSVKAVRVPVDHGDAVVWGGAARLTYHGVAALVDGLHPLAGRFRFNLSFRRAG